MSELADSFEKLLGRQPTDAERQQLYKVRDALGLKNNDALWLILMVLQYHQNQYEKMPQTIAEAAEKILLEIKGAAEATLKASAETTKAELTQVVSKTAHNIAYQVAGKQKIQWIALCFLATGLIFSLFGYYVHHSAFQAGYNSGQGIGYEEAKDEKAAAAWANTPEGKRAYRFAQSPEAKDERAAAAWANTPDGKVAYRFTQSGALQMLAQCRGGSKWKKEDGICRPYPESDGRVYGWRLP